MQITAAHVATKAMADLGGSDKVIDRGDVERLLTTALRDGDVAAAGKATMALGVLTKTGDDSVTQTELTTMFRDQYFHADALDEAKANAALGEFSNDVATGAAGLDLPIATAMTDPEPLKGLAELMKLVDKQLA